MDLLRLLTCGSVDDGKSTLIGRLLHDSKDIYEDHLRGLERDSARMGSAGDGLDYALLLDGLKAEREQGITIDVAYRYFSTPRRKFIIADCPGHVQYTRNMVTGASTANLAIVLIDATKGVLEQTRRHSFLVSLLDIGHLIVAVNKMDLVDYSESVFDEICAEFTDFATRLGVGHIHFMPISALKGDNVVDRSTRMDWFGGRPLLSYLERVHIASDRNLIDLRFPVQYVIRPDRQFRGYAGTVASGILRPGTDVVVLPSGKRTRIAALHGPAGELDEAFPPMAVTVTVTDEIDISRGDLLVHPRNVPRSASELEAILVWMAEAPLVVGRPYRIKHGTKLLQGSVGQLRYRFDIQQLHRESAETLALNEIGRVRLDLDQPLPHDPYRRNKATGSLILIDPESNQTVGAGMIIDRQGEPDTDEVAPRHSTHVQQQRGSVTAAERQDRFKQQPVTLWLTGLPRSGKSTLSFALERELFDAGYAVHVLDGENLRLGISANLGFSALDRSENARRAAHLARLNNRAGLISIVALVSPFAADRAAARKIIGAERFHEIYLSAPLDSCEARDPEGLYRRARTGEIERFTGISSPYEAPKTPDLELATQTLSLRDSVSAVIAYLESKGALASD